MRCWGKVQDLLVNKSLTIRRMSTLHKVGKLQVPETLGEYQAGQFFLHKTFAYRGLILFPWNARLFDRTLNVKTSLADRSSNEINGETELKYEPVTYYNALIDLRDRPYIKVQNDVVCPASAFRVRGRDVNYHLPGLDYVSHQEIIPFASSDWFQHELLSKLFTDTHTDSVPPASLIASESLRQVEKENHEWMDSTEIHSETTEGIRVTIIPFFAGPQGCQQNETFWWRYCVRLENLTNDPVHLRERHLRMSSFSGKFHTQSGRGVVGAELMLSPGCMKFQYCSHVSLDSKSGTMWGNYVMERENGSKFEVRIPPCQLKSQVFKS